MAPPDPATISAWGFAIIMGVAATFERIRNAKQTKIHQDRAQANSETRAEADGLRAVIKVKDEIITALQEEHDQHLKYRENHHKLVQEVNAKMLVLTEENAVLRSRSDLSPILEQMKIIQTSSIKMMEALESLTEKVHSICDFHEDERQERQERRERSA